MSKLLRQRWGLSRPPDVPFEINRASPQSEGLVTWMPSGGGDPGTHRHVDRVRGLTFTEGGTPTWTLDGEYGWAIQLVRTSSEYLTSSGIPVSSPPITFTCRAKFSSLPASGAYMWLVSLADHDADDSFNMSIVNSAGTYVLLVNERDGGVDHYASLAFAANTTDWFHFAGVFNSTTRECYVNSSGPGTDNGDGAANATGLSRTVTGAFHTASTIYHTFDGTITDVRIYNAAKVGTQVYQIYADPWDLAKPIRRLWQVKAPAAPPTGQPIHLRALTIPHLRQWQPRVAS